MYIFIILNPEGFRCSLKRKLIVVCIWKQQQHRHADRQIDRQQSASGSFLMDAEMMTKNIPSKCGPIYNTGHRAKAPEDGVGEGERGRV